jgi:CheY-like chemotaxis protein
MHTGSPACNPHIMLRCLIVDNSLRFLDSARELLEREGVTVVGVASTSAEALLRFEELRPDVTLVDIDLGPDSGLDLARRLQRGPDPAAPVILISTYDEHDYADLIAASPAVGFLAKSDLSAQAIRQLLRGRGGSERETSINGPPGK